MISVKIKFLGGAKEVGRIAIAVKTEKSQILLDYGVLFGREPGFPMHVPPKEVDAVILTHAHLDHSGTIPIFQIQEKKPVYGTQPTFGITELLISDFIHLSGYYLPFEYLELRSTMKSCVHLNYREKQVIGDITIQLLNAGHIPGSSQVLLETNGKR
ncbi:MBL fold metallo-hydrolase, partial [Candidatus Bathyarchaeota archaeon]|nr:MBL fold metallo-hydrolase [Candidatus Bathyarchaeota archaeon]